jgi:hypothetical protein
MGMSSGGTNFGLRSAGAAHALEADGAKKNAKLKKYKIPYCMTTLLNIGDTRVQTLASRRSSGTLNASGGEVMGSFA